jgi:hypothetical protein
MKGRRDKEVEVYGALLSTVPEWQAPVRRVPLRDEFTEREKIFFSFLRACGEEGATLREVAQNTGISERHARDIAARWLGKLVEHAGRKRVSRGGCFAKTYRLRRK